MPMKMSAQHDEHTVQHATTPEEQDNLLLGSLPTGAQVLFHASENGGWGLAIQGPGLTSFDHAYPLQFEIMASAGDVQAVSGSYQTVTISEEGIAIASGDVSVFADVVLSVQDQWSIATGILHVSRTVQVRGDAEGGFLSAITVLAPPELEWVETSPFAPGMLYGSPEHITGTAIGGLTGYLSGVRHIRIREDRLPAPLFGLHLNNGSSLTMLVVTPQAQTTAADAVDVQAGTMTDTRFSFGALGVEEQRGRLALGYWYPGTEGEMTYRGDTFPGGQVHGWRHRYHPLQDGFIQHYTVAYRVGRDERFVEYRSRVWRWSWKVLAPTVMRQDIGLVRQTLEAMLADRVTYVAEKAGLPLAADAVTGRSEGARYRSAFMGFTGRSIESAYFLLRAVERSTGAQATRYQTLAYDVLETFARLPMAPPEAEGFSLLDGQPVDHLGDLMYLRSLCEGAAYMLRAWQHELWNERSNPHWLSWSHSFANWLLTQQYSDGGFPRAWYRGGRPLDRPSPEASYNAIPFLISLNAISGERRYLDAAIRAGEFCWATNGGNGLFVGGTIDNPNVVDKEAGTISLEAYLMLYEATAESFWLRRAQVAGDFAESWIYLWDVPMPADDDDARRHWKAGQSTVGLQLIASGHSLVDTYMAWDVASYAKLYRYTGDSHYRAVAQLLLHNTKIMLALPGRTYDLAGPGWQQEHWSLAPRRGYGIHRLWLPWITCSHLYGIESLEEFDPILFAELIQDPPTEQQP